MSVRDRDRLFVKAPGWSAENEPTVLLGVPSPLVYSYLAGETKEEDPTAVGGMRMRAYTDAEFCALTLLVFLNAAQGRLAPTEAKTPGRVGPAALRRAPGVLKVRTRGLFTTSYG